MPSVGFIGGGNMTSSLIGGLITAGFPAEQIIVTEPADEQRKHLQSLFHVSISADNNDTLQSDVVVLAVKPQLLRQVCQQLDHARISENTLFISIAAGVRSTDISRWLGNSDLAIVRCMPNTPSLLQCGASGLFANEQVSNQQKQLAEQIMQAVGIVVWVDTEDALNAVTAVSGSGPAYFFLMMEAMQQAGEKLGLSAEVSTQLVLQTALGAARMATESDVAPDELRRRVTSKGGTTEQALDSFASDDYSRIVLNALKAASDRSKSLADELGYD